MWIGVTKENKAQQNETWRAYEVNINTVAFWDLTLGSLAETY